MARDVYHYYFHGFDVSSEVSLGFDQERRPARKKGMAHLHLVHADQLEPELTEAIWKSAETFPNGTPHFSLHLHQDQPLLYVPLTGRFLFRGDTVWMFLEPNAFPAPYLMGKVFGLWMELKGVPVLHGSCLDIGGSGAGLLGFSGMGKSTLGAALWSRACSLVTDDLIPINPQPPHWVDPGIPMSRMWPDTAQKFIPDHGQLEKVHPNFHKFKVPNKLNGIARFVTEPRPLGALFILERKPDEITPHIEKIHPAGALVELVRHSYHPDLVRALGLQQKRMSLLASLMVEVPVFRLTYPSGYQHLETVCARIFDRMNSLAALS